MPNGRGIRPSSCNSVRRVDAILADRLAIRDVVETWASARDSGDWDAFRACWHDDGYMMATWFQGPKEDFIRVSQEGVARGVNILHFTGGCRITLNGTRAIAQTRMTIMQRAEVDGVLCDVNCLGRFYDFMEKRDGRWGMVLRQPIYEKDRLDPVEPGASLTLDPELLARFPEGSVTWPTCRSGSATRSTPTCRACAAPRWSGYTSAAPPGWPAQPVAS